MAWKDNELTNEEVEVLKEKIEDGKVDDAIDLMGKVELETFKDKVVSKDVVFTSKKETSSLEKEQEIAKMIGLDKN